MKQETLTVFKNFSQINKSIRINKGNVLTIFNSTIPLFGYAKVEDEFPKTFSIYDLNQWLATISLFNEPNIVYEDKQMLISSGRMAAKYRYSAPASTADQPSNPPSVPETLFSFKMPREQLAEILKASSVLGLKELEFSIKGLKTYTSDSNGNPIDNEYSSNIEDVEFTDESLATPVKIKVEALKLLPLDYKVEITEKAVIFTSEDGNISYYAGLIKQ